MFLVSLACSNNYIQGMKRSRCNDTTLYSIPLGASYFDYCPDEIIEKITACCTKKNLLMRLNTLFLRLCSKKNAVNILPHTLLVLDKFDKRYFMNYYAHEDDKYINIVTNLLNHRASLAYNAWLGMNPLVCASDGLNEKILTLFIQRGLKPIKHNQQQLTLLHKAVYYGNINLVKSLIDLKIDINNQNIPAKATPILIASYIGNTDIVQLLLENGANVNLVDDENDTPLHCACLHGHFTIAQSLLEHGTNVNVVGGDGDTPLHYACAKGYFYLVRLLLKHKANIHVTNDIQETPLHKASRNGRFTITKLLLKKKADINATDEDNTTPLQKACLHGRFKVAQLLITHGANINVRNKDDRTPLHDACFSGHLKIVELLLKNGANVHKKDNKGNTPLQIAYEREHTNIAKFFIEKMSENKNL